MSSDCDEDTILVQVRPDGPACHTGSRTCFVRSADPGPQGFADLERLWDRIQQRLRVGDASSYTVRLLDGGVDAAGRKVIEEAAEVVEAAQQHDRGIADDTRLAEESADLMYHLLALLAERDVSPSQLIEELAGRR